MHDLGLSPAEAARVRSGEIVVSDPAPSSPRELAVGLTFLVQQPVADVVAAFWSAVDMQGDDQLRGVAVLHDAPDDVTPVALPADEARRYLSARPGDALNLSTDEIRAFAAAATSPDAPVAAQRILRRLLFERYRVYRASGLAGIAPYTRDGDAVRKPADELGGACDAGGLLERYAPPLWALLHSYPRGAPPGFEERFYALTYDLDGRPNYALRHRIALPFGGGVVVADRDFYVSRGYNTALTVGGLFPVPDGTIVFYANRVSTDQLLGMGASLRQNIGRSVMAKRLTAIFERSRACFEREATCGAPVAAGRALAH
jgi:hypothetical protein